MNTIIRASSLPSYPDCSRRWAARTIPQEIIAAGFDLAGSMRTSIGASVGTATHGGAAFIMAEKMKSGLLGNQTEAEQKALEDFDTAAQGGVLWDEATPNMNDAQKQVVRMVKVFRNTVAIQVQPLAVERRLEARVGEGFVLSGQSDLQTIEPGRIRDLKTGRFPRMHHAQLGAYSLLARTAHPEQPTKEICVDFIQRVALAKPQPDTKTDFYDQAVAEQAAINTIDHMRKDVTEFRRRIQEGEAAPEHAFLANPASMLCTEKWCPAWNTSFCREFKPKQ
jgi:PD-(D/E)XK nuclease superfamily